MSQLSPGFLNPSGWRGEIDGPETWWAELQEALGTCSGHATDLVGTNKRLFNSEDGQIQAVSDEAWCSRSLMNFRLRVCTDATRISDGKPVMLKKLPNAYELQVNKLFSTEPLSLGPETAVHGC